MTLVMTSDGSTECTGFSAEYLMQPLSPTAPPVDFQSLLSKAPTIRPLPPFTTECPEGNYTLLDEQCTDDCSVKYLNATPYDPNLNVRIAIRPASPPASIRATVKYISTEEGYDTVRIYDRPRCLGGTSLAIL